MCCERWQLWNDWILPHFVSFILLFLLFRLILFLFSSRSLFLLSLVAPIPPLSFFFDSLLVAKTDNIALVTNVPMTLLLAPSATSMHKRTSVPMAPALTMAVVQLARSSNKHCMFLYPLYSPLISSSLSSSLISRVANSSLRPGNPCTHNDQCYFSSTSDGSGSVASTCNNGICAGKMVGESCSFSHQCYVGSFCSAGTCKSLGQSGASCNNDSECSSRFTCFNSVCSSRYTQSPGQSCSSTNNCQPGLYCKSGTCSSVKSASSSNSKCDLSSASCSADEECACQGFTTQGQTATCSKVKGTYSNMPAIEKAAYTCMDINRCGSDLGNSSTLSCLSSHCEKDFCTYFTRANNDLFTQFPSCLVSRMSDSADYYIFVISKCASYAPTLGGAESSTSTTGMSAATSHSPSFHLVLFAVAAIFLF